MQGDTWFTADLHFGHSRIIEHCKRPFASVDEMDDALIERWNAVVRPRDDVWVVGDFAFRGGASAESYLRRLSGKKHLVIGNHDDRRTIEAAGWRTVTPMHELRVDGSRLTLCHYALRVWNRSGAGALHFYGHSHGRLPGDRQSLDVGVDCWDFLPVSLADIRQRLATLPERGSTA